MYLLKSRQRRWKNNWWFRPEQRSDVTGDNDIHLPIYFFFYPPSTISFTSVRRHWKRKSGRFRRHERVAASLRLTVHGHETLNIVTGESLYLVTKPLVVDKFPRTAYLNTVVSADKIGRWNVQNAIRQQGGKREMQLVQIILSLFLSLSCFWSTSPKYRL